MPQSFVTFAPILLGRLIALGLAWVWLTGGVCPVAAQEVRESLAGEKAAQAAKKGELMPDYNLQWGPLSLRVEATFHAEFTDNVFNSGINRRNDLILRPEIKLKSVWPVTELNALTLSLGVGYQYYVNNTQLNANAPLISPDSELALLLYVKNFRFRFHERFSYQESLFYSVAYSAQSSQFINLTNVGTFGRIDNVAGLAVDWDLGSMVLSVNYDHENFISMLSYYDYLSRASELVSSRAEVILGPEFRSGLESKASWTAYDTHKFPDHGRARVGPFVDISPSEYVSLQVGGGYESVSLPETAGLKTESSPYYAYARASHTVNDWLSYSLAFAHENQLGWTTANLITTYVGLSASLRFIDKVELLPIVYYGWGEESGPNHAGHFWRDNYNYFHVSLGLLYHFGERWTADLRYDYFQKDSNMSSLSFFRNGITAGVTYRF